jgi:hypothetical protein
MTGSRAKYGLKARVMSAWENKDIKEKNENVKMKYKGGHV